MSPQDIGIYDEEYLTDGKVNSTYLLRTGDAIWITTEADRSVTTALLLSCAYLEEFGPGF